MEYPSFDKPKAGAFRFNTDNNQLEIYDGNQWTGVLSTSPELQTGGTRMCMGGGWVPGGTDRIALLQIHTTGSIEDFGDLDTARYSNGGYADRTRGVFTGGRNDPAPSTSMTNKDYFAMASGGQATNWLVLSTARESQAGFSDSTRGMDAGGKQNGAQLASIDYTTIQSAGESVDWGDLTVARGKPGGCSSPTRGIVFCGDGPDHTTYHNTIQYVTISTTGNGSDFGDSAVEQSSADGGSNAVRGVLGCGIASPAYSRTLEYVTMATLGNAIDFGDSIAANNALASRATGASSTRVVWAAGAFPSSPYAQSDVEYVNIASTGNGIDWGDALDNNEASFGISNGHGGL